MHRTIRPIALSVLIAACAVRADTPPPASAGTRPPPTIDAPPASSRASTGALWSAPMPPELRPTAVAIGPSPEGVTAYVAGTDPNGSKGALWGWSSAGQAIDAFEFSDVPRAVASDDRNLWVATVAEIYRLDPETGARTTLQLEPGTDISALEVGYGETLFVADANEATVFALVDGRVEVLVKGPEVGRPQVLRLVGGQLFVGDSSENGDLRVIDLASRQIKTVAPGVGPVTGIGVDHIGYLALSVEGRGLVRVIEGGQVIDLPLETATGVAFDPGSRRLISVDARSRRVMAYDYLRLVGDDPAVWDQRDSRPMQMFEIDGIVLSGAEYWPFRGDRPPKYPDDVLWGFYPQQGVVFEGAASVASATPEAIACAERSHAALRDWVEASPAKFRRAVELGASNRFYLWTNDYSQAVTPFPQPVRKNRLWYWQRDPAVVGRVPGFWKWETTLTQAGECLIPEREQIDEYLGQKVRELEKRSRP